MIEVGGLTEANRMKWLSALAYATGWIDNSRTRGGLSGEVRRSLTELGEYLAHAKAEDVLRKQFPPTVLEDIGGLTKKGI